MENFIKKKSHLTEDEINELLYYYEQGINVGKEEIIIKIINNLNKMTFDIETISKIVEQPVSKVNQYLI